MKAEGNGEREAIRKQGGIWLLVDAEATEEQGIDHAEKAILAPQILIFEYFQSLFKLPS